MDEQQFHQLSCGNPNQIQTVLREFNTKNANLFDFTKMRENDKWNALWKRIFMFLNDDKYEELYPICLNVVRILTRDEKSLQDLDMVEDLLTLIRLAKLNIEAKGKAGELENKNVNANHLTEETISEALKCLCNLVFQNKKCRSFCTRLHVADAILKRFPLAMREGQSVMLQLFMMKLLFLLTAMEQTVKTRVTIDLNGMAYMTEWLDEKLVDAAGNIDEQLDLICEMLKVMFNISVCPDKSPNEHEIQGLHLTGVLRDLIIRFGQMKSNKEKNVVTHAINLLTNMSGSCLAELTTKCENDMELETPQMLCFEKRNVRVLEILLRYLSNVLTDVQEHEQNSELVPSILLVLVKCSRSNVIMRHYIRKIVLPPLKDVSQRPEVGNELRNHLCRFLTQPSMINRDLAAELLFVCCKEKVGRMIKYTGYGNAAGLFASRGILDCRQLDNTDYSSDSEDSDTEEYKLVQENINPVLGCYEPPRRNPLEGMSEEQKEYEAMELVKLMDKLHKTGVVQPCRIGEDGKPQPVDHILQLQEELPQQQLEQKPHPKPKRKSRKQKSLAAKLKSFVDFFR